MLNSNLEFVEKNEYTTLGGPFFPSDGCALASNPANIANMVTRMTNCVKPEVPGFHELLVSNQDKFFTSEYLDLDIFDRVTAKIAAAYLQRKEGMEEKVLRAGNKKALYEHVYKQLKDEGRIYERGGGTVANEAKQKKEFYQRGATARLFVNLGVPSTLSHGDTLHKAKEYLNEEPIIMRHNGKVLKLVFLAKPKTDTLQEWITDLICPENDVTAYIHSDDASVIVKNENGSIETFNVDISKCDRSHGPRTFAALSTIFDTVPHLHEECMEFIMRPVDLRAKNIPSLRARLWPLLPYLPSGHLYTTLINTLVMMCIIQWFFKNAKRGREGIMEAGEKLGFLLKVDKAANIYDNQLLKHSPCLDVNGFYRPLKNIGVLLRALGKADQDYAGEGSVEKRAQFQALNVIKSYSAGVEVPFMERWKDRLSRGTKSLSKRTKESIYDVVRRQFDYKIAETSSTVLQFSDAAVFERYHDGVNDKRAFQTLAERLPGMGVGHHFRGVCTSAILAKDYELGDPEEGGWLGDWG
jgi:hypothetical protein